MKELVSILLLVIAISLASIFFPAWWWVMLFPILFGLLFPGSVHKSFFLGFLAGLLVWGGYSLYQFMKGSELITGRMAELLSLPSGTLLLLIVTLLGGLLAGVSAATGSSIRSFFAKPKSRSIDYY